MCSGASLTPLLKYPASLHNNRGNEKAYRSTTFSVRLLIINSFQLAYGGLGMIVEKRGYPLLMDQFTVNACPDNVTSRTYDPLSESGVLTWVLRTVTKDTDLSFEMTRIVGAIFSFG